MLRSQPARSSFYLAITVWMAALAVIGFWPTYFGPVLGGRLAITPVLGVHAVVFLGWMLLLILQSFLVFVGKVGLHRRLGVLGVGYAGIMVAVGLWVTFDRFFLLLQEEGARAAHRSLVIPFVDLLLFVSFFGAAVLYRRRPESHKRLMIVASVVLLGPAVGRMTFLTSIPLVFVVLLSPILLGIAFDLVTRRRFHPAYGIGVVVFIASGARLALRESEAWFRFSKWILGIFL